MKKLILGIALAMFAGQAQAAGTGCQDTSGPGLTLEKIRSTAVGTQAFGCLNRSFDLLSASAAFSWAGSSASHHTLYVGTITALFASDIYITSATTMTGNLTLLDSQLLVPSTFYVRDGQIIGENPFTMYGASLSVSGAMIHTSSSILSQGVIYTGGGSAGTPTFAFGTDSDTGFYLSGANEISHTAGGTQYWSFTADGTLRANQAQVIHGVGTLAIGAGSADSIRFNNSTQSSTFLASTTVLGAGSYTGMLGVNGTLTTYSSATVNDIVAAEFSALSSNLGVWSESGLQVRGGWASGQVHQIAFGGGNGTYAPAGIAYVGQSGAGRGQGDVVIYNTNTTSDVEATERVRITDSDGIRIADTVTFISSATFSAQTLMRRTGTVLDVRDDQTGSAHTAIQFYQGNESRFQFEFNASDDSVLRLRNNAETDIFTWESGTQVFYSAPLASAPGTCSIGEWYVDTSGAYCACTVTNTWENLSGTGTCS